MNALVKQPYEARFSSLLNEGGELAFPCDAQGMVNLDGLSNRARNNYFYARALIGREFAAPVVMVRSELSAPHQACGILAPSHCASLAFTSTGFSCAIQCPNLAHGSPAIDRPPAHLGEHTDEVLREFGFAEADIGRMQADKVFGSAKAEAPVTA